MIVQVKICGILTPEHARAAVGSGADYLGLVFAPSRRQVTLAAARNIVAAAREAAAARNSAIDIVGVFVNEAPATINAIAADVGLDWVQLSGHEAAEIRAAIKRPVIKAIRFDDHLSERAWLDPTITASLLVDAHVTGSFGGAGVIGDWKRAAELARTRTVWLAGGLTPANAADAVKNVQPRVVDVSSGVETAGVKDEAKIAAFIHAAKHALSNGAELHEIVALHT